VNGNPFYFQYFAVPLFFYLVKVNTQVLLLLHFLFFQSGVCEKWLTKILTFLRSIEDILNKTHFILGAQDHLEKPNFLGNFQRGEFSMLDLKHFRDSNKGLSDLLEYAAIVDNGVILNKSGSLMAGWFYRGEDYDSATRDILDHLSHRINQAISKLGTGWCLHVDACRMPVESYPMENSHFPDPISKLIEEERSSFFKSIGTQYQTIYVLILTYQPPLKAHNKLIDILYADTGEPEKNFGDRVLEYFNETIKDIENQLSYQLSMTRINAEMASDEVGRKFYYDRFLQYLNYCISGENHPIRLPRTPMYIDSLIGGHQLVTGTQPKLNKNYFSVIAIDGLPQESYASILSDLDRQGTAYRWSTRFIFLDPSRGEQELQGYRRKWKQKTIGFVDQLVGNHGGPINYDAVEMVEDIDGALSEISSRTITYGYYTSNIILFGKTAEEVDSKAQIFRNVIQALGFSARIEDLNTVEAWLGSLPGHVEPNVRRPMIHTLNLADLLPISSVWAGAEFNPCPMYPENSPPVMMTLTTGSTPFRFNLHFDDLGHTLIFGPPGSGKSTLISTLSSQFMRYPNAKVFAFDKGNSLLAFTKAIGGMHYDVASDSNGLQFCPLSRIENENEQAWAEEWIAQLIELQGVAVLPSHRNKIHQAMTILKKESPKKTLTEFVTTLQDKELKEALQHYTVSGSMGSILDAETENLEFSNFQVFEMEKIMDLGDRNIIPVLQYIFHRIEKSLDGNPALLIIDEAWMAFSHKFFRDKLKEWLKVFRKLNCAVVPATQSVSDAIESGILTVLKESCPTKIFLANPEAMSEDIHKLYKSLGLNEREIQIISQMTRKKDYYYTSVSGKRVFDLALGPLTLAFVGSSKKEDVEIIYKLSKSNQSKDWIIDFLKYKNVDSSIIRKVASTLKNETQTKFITKQTQQGETHASL
jgi:type IV secretion/conjugal transfer VirB4 family ATPase